MNLNCDRFVPSKNKDTFYFEHIQRYKFSKKFVKNKKILDLGSGSGYGSFELIKLGAKEVISIDIDPKIIKFAKEKYHNDKLTFQIADATSLPFKDNEFDVVISFEVIEHIKNYQNYLREVFRVLRPKGYFIFSTPNRLKHRAGTSAYHFKEFTPNELKKIFKKNKIKLYGQFFEDLSQIKAEEEYFQRYKKLTFGGNKKIKKLFNLIPSFIKVAIYKVFWHPLPQISLQQMKISYKNINKAITLIGVVKN